MFPGKPPQPSLPCVLSLQIRMQGGEKRSGSILRVQVVLKTDIIWQRYERFSIIPHLLLLYPSSGWVNPAWGFFQHICLQSAMQVFPAEAAVAASLRVLSKEGKRETTTWFSVRQRRRKAAEALLKHFRSRCAPPCSRRKPAVCPFKGHKVPSRSTRIL